MKHVWYICVLIYWVNGNWTTIYVGCLQIGQEGMGIKMGDYIGETM